MLSEKVLQAWEFAKEKHGDQQYGNHSYLYHLDRVLGLTIQMGLDEHSQIVAILHDTLEDTDTTFKELVEIFGGLVAYDVYVLTKQQETSYEDYLKLISQSPYAKKVKICDILSNLQESIKTNKYQLAKKYQNALFLLSCEY